MFIEIKKVFNRYTRPSKKGVEHSYSRVKSVVVFRCDSCDCLFERDLGKMERRRVSNRFFHVCADCDSKKFAQKKSVERRKFWDLPVNSDIDISKN